jgi:hypothetical protein
MSEFARFLDTLKAMGCSFAVNWSPSATDESHALWQGVINDAGHNFTARACTVIEVQRTQFLFLNDQGVFILTRDKDTGKVEFQRRMNGNGKESGERRIISFTNGNQRLEDLQRVDDRAR